MASGNPPTRTLPVMVMLRVSTLTATPEVSQVASRKLPSADMSRWSTPVNGIFRNLRNFQVLRS